MHERLKIGDVEADPATNEIRRAGQVLHVEPKVMDVLAILARNAGQVVSREALLAKGWPGSIVGDEALTQCVIKLRRVLGDDPRAARYIETIPKRGYRLIAPVQALQAGDGAGSAATRVLVPSGAGVRTWPYRAVAIGAAPLALAGVLMLFAGRGTHPDDTSMVAAVPLRSAEAKGYFAGGQQKLLVRGGTENVEARALFREAIERDPTFARAYATLAMTYALEARLGGSDAARRALELAETARLMDPRDPDIHWTLGFVHVQARQHADAIASLTRALELDASFADAYALLGGVYTYIGEPRRSIPLLRTAMLLKPDGGYLYFLLLGRAYLFQGDVEQALVNLRAAAQRNPADVETHAYLAAGLLAAGDRAGARWESEEVRALQPGFSAARWLGTYPMTDASQRERLAGLLAGAGL